jgi:hypothetical protein
LDYVTLDFICSMRQDYQAECKDNPEFITLRVDGFLQVMSMLWGASQGSVNRLKLQNFHINLALNSQ